MHIFHAVPGSGPVSLDISGSQDCPEAFDISFLLGLSASITSEIELGNFCMRNLTL
jgi:hypothetical protein